jgi:hypothetical protein
VRYFIAKETRKISKSHKIIIETQHSTTEEIDMLKRNFFDGFFSRIHFECEINSQNGFRIYIHAHTHTHTLTARRRASV